MPWPNPFVEEIFVDIHTKFFRDCPTEELSDPPPAIVFALVITPICLIPVMVSLVVLKTKNGDGSSWKARISVFRLQDNNYFKNFIAPFLSQLGETSLFTHVHGCLTFISSGDASDGRFAFFTCAFTPVPVLIHSEFPIQQHHLLHPSILHTHTFKKKKKRNLNFTVFGIMITRAP